MKVLVTCASPHGSTQGIAESIASRLRESGLTVDCVPIDDAPSLSAYDAVVAGSAIHDQAWLPEAARFLSAHAAELRRRPVWLFSVGMPDALARPLRGVARREGPAVLAPFTEMVRPQGTHLFSGVLSKQHFPAAGRAALRLAGGRYGDFRDWPEIDTWAMSIADRLHGATSDNRPAARR
jgi:menaquinone-dependent protoporphyrinogen oxidase